VVLEFYRGGERSESGIGAPLVVRINPPRILRWVDDRGIVVEAAGGGEIFYGRNAIISIRLQPI
jgi:hypothetical protein